MTTSQRENLARMMSERKQVLREEIRSGLARIGNEGYAEQLSGTADAGDESVATMLSDLANAEVARDVAELRDILAAEARIAAGTYGTCIYCGRPIPHARLAAYPTAKRCVACQQHREATRAPSGPR